jgi:Zn-dependent protease
VARNGYIKCPDLVWFDLGRLFGIEIGLHYSWLIIALLITLSLAGHFRVHNPSWSEGVMLGTATITAALFFTSIIHALSHAAFAKSRGLPVRSITMFALAGASDCIELSSSWVGVHCSSFHYQGTLRCQPVLSPLHEVT